MPTLLQINVTANWGSTGKIAEQIGLCAMAHGWESVIAYGRMMNPSKSRLIKVGTQMDVYEHYVEGRFLDNEGLASRRATRKFLRQLDELKPDIVHLHNIHDHWINYRLLLGYLAEKKIPVVWTQHDQWATTGHCMCDVNGCERWKTECHDCPLRKWYSLDCSRRNYRLKKKLMAELPSLTIVPVSDWLDDNIQKSHLRNRRIEVIHNGIDINTFSPQPANAHNRYGIDKKKKIVLGVAAVWEERKGYYDFFELARMLPADEYAIIIVGKTKEKPKAIEDGCQMVFIDRTQNQQELAMLYSMADVYCSLSRYETFGLTIIEAMACGTSAIVYDNTGQANFVTEETGRKVRTNNIQSVAEQIQCLAKYPLSAEACRNRVVQHFDKDKCVEKYVALYNSLVRAQDNTQK